MDGSPSPLLKVQTIFLHTLPIIYYLIIISQYSSGLLHKSWEEFFNLSLGRNYKNNLMTSPAPHSVYNMEGERGRVLVLTVIWERRERRESPALRSVLSRHWWRWDVRRGEKERERERDVTWPTLTPRREGWKLPWVSYLSSQYTFYLARTVNWFRNIKD